MLRKKLIAIVICAALFLTMLPVTAFAAGGTVKGKVTISGTRTVIVGAKVTATGPGGTFYATTGTLGTYTISGVAAGTYTVTCEASGYNTASATANVVDGKSVTVNFALTKATVTTGTISGTVKNSSGAAIAGASVKTSTGGYSATTDSTGKYTLSNVAAGSYSLVAEATGYLAQSKSAVVEGGKTTVVDFALVAQAAGTRYEVTHTFSINDVHGNNAGTKFGTACLDMNNPWVGADKLTYYNVDSDFGYDVEDYVGATERPMDGVYAEGSVANVLDSTGAVIGIKGITPPPAHWLAGTLLTGEWNRDATGKVTKTSTEHYLTMEHWLNAPGAPALVYGTDYRARFKDDGKKLYMWGNLNNDPTDLRLYARVPLPDAWKVKDANYKVTSAKLVITHLTAASPNDQVRPEDIENENATGILPQYKVESDGSWVSTVDAYDGCGHFLPKGTLMRMAQPILVPNVDEFGTPLKDFLGNTVTEPDVVYHTAAWYLSLDRDPFAGLNPRWRLKAAVYGQDLSATAIPQYTAGAYTTSTLDLLAPMTDAVTGNPGPSVLTDSKNWFNYMDGLDGTIDGVTANGVPATPDFDLSQYIKGTLSGQVIYNAKLIVDYEGGSTAPSGNDVTIASASIPTQVKMLSNNTLSVSVKNNVAGAASGTLTLVGTDSRGKTYPFETAFTTTSGSTATTYTFAWQAPNYTTTVNWVATVSASGDTDTANNRFTAATKVVR